MRPSSPSGGVVGWSAPSAAPRNFGADNATISAMPPADRAPDEIEAVRKGSAGLNREPVVRERYAPGWPGTPGRCTSSAKRGVGTALSPFSEVWFTLSHGILNEVYYPRIDQACTRDLGLIVTDGATFFSEEKRHARSVVRMVEDGVPAYRLVNICGSGRYRIEKTVLADPRRDVILQHVRFVALQGSAEDYRLYVLVAPHLGNRGAGNTGWIGGYKDVPMLLAEGNRNALALASSAPWRPPGPKVSGRPPRS
jgi:glucoamylase